MLVFGVFTFQGGIHEWIQTKHRGTNGIIHRYSCCMSKKRVSLKSLQKNRKLSMNFERIDRKILREYRDARHEWYTPEN